MKIVLKEHLEILTVTWMEREVIAPMPGAVLLNLDELNLIISQLVAVIKLTMTM